MTGSVRVNVDGFGFRYAGHTDWAVLDADLLIQPGERILLTGASGAGKSTLLSAMAGLLGPDAGDPIGEIRLDGRPARTARDRVGIVFQDPDSQLVMGRVADEVAFGLENRGIAAEEIWPRVREALDAVGFGHRLDHSTHALSGGEKQRLVLAGALVARPGLLLLDEPTSQLDPDGAELVREAVARILADRATTLVLIDHDAGRWLPLIDRVVEVPFVPSEGRLLPIGSPEGRLHSAESGRSGGSGEARGIQELPRDWRPAVPPLPPRRPTKPSEGRLLPIGSPEGRLHSERMLWAEGAGFSYPSDPICSPGLSGPVRPSLAPTDVELRAGEICAITGPNGSGKSTLGLLLAGLRAPQVGRIVASPELAGHLGSRAPHRWRARDLVLRIGTVFQNPEHHFLTGRVRDELSLGPLRAGAGHRNAQQRAEELLVRLGLSAYADANPFTLSGGQQRRLSVAAALATRPSVLVLDEPTFGQDPVTWQELLALLAEARDDGAAICLISHDQRLVTEFADYRVDLASSSPQPGGFGQNRHGTG